MVFFSLFFIGSIFSLYDSKNVLVSSYYIVWIMFSFIVVYEVFKAIARRYGYLVLRDVYIFSFRFQILLSVFMFFLMRPDNGRVSLFYYEPSYFSIAAIPYLCIVFGSFFDKKVKTMFLDVVFVFLLLVVGKSANLMLIIALSIFFSFIISNDMSVLKKIKMVFFLLVFSFFGLFLMYFFDKGGLVINSILNVINSEDSIEALILRMGNRWPRLEITLDVLRNVFPYGIGPGSFKFFTIDYTSGIDFRDTAQWLNPVGLPAINIFFEVLVECGVLGALGFYGICIIPLIAAIKNGNSVIICTILVFLISLSFESSYLRLYFWAFLGISYGVSLYDKENRF